MNAQHSIATPARCEISTIGMMSATTVRAAQLAVIRSAPGADGARQALDVPRDVRPGPRQTDVGGVDAEGIHPREEVDFRVDVRRPHRRRLQSVAQRLVIQHHPAAASRQGGGGSVLIPVVNQRMRDRHRVLQRGVALVLRRSYVLAAFYVGAASGFGVRLLGAAPARSQWRRRRTRRRPHRWPDGHRVRSRDASMRRCEDTAVSTRRPHRPHRTRHSTRRWPTRPTGPPRPTPRAADCSSRPTTRTRWRAPDHYP